MKYFCKLHEGCDVVPLLHILTAHKGLWNENRIRQTFPDSPHREVEDIILRGQKLEGDSVKDILKAQNDLQCYNYPVFDVLPQIRHFIFSLMGRIEATQLGRVIITKLAPGKQIYKHKDTGKYSEAYNRYHLVIQSGMGAIFNIEEEAVTMKSGEVWWIDKLAEHSVVNNSAIDRIHLIIDAML